MSWGQTLATAWHAIRSHALRSLLTVFGILIGIAAVIVTVGLGLGTQKDVSDQISSLGSNLLIVSPGSSTDGSGMRGGFGTATSLTVDDADALTSDVAAPDVAAVAPEKTSSLALEANDTNWTTSVTATTPAWDEVREREVTLGRFLDEDDDGSTVVVLGPGTATELFGSTRVVGQTVVIEGVNFQVIGVLAEAGSSTSTNLDDIALVPLGTASRTIMGGTTATSLSQIYVQAASADVLSAAHQQTTELLTNLHGFASADEADFSVSSQAALVETATSVYQTLTVLLTGVAALSLIVGGIGVMNIQLVSVSERTREIGLRKALGAPPGAIRRQFLVEAAILGLAGGLAGVGVGLAAIWLLPGLVGTTLVASAPIVFLALGIAVGIALLFGVYPATRAARLTPIDALRAE